MIKKNHRPKPIIKPNRTSQISVRMTPMERMLIESRAKLSGYSMSSFLVESAMGKQMKIISDLEKETYLNLATFHTNFNRISSLIKEGNPIDEELKIVISELREQLQIIKNGK